MQLPTMDKLTPGPPSTITSSNILHPSSPGFNLLPIKKILDSLHLTVRQMDILTSHLHHIRRLNIADSTSLYLQVSPPASVPLLRQERQALQTEAITLSLLSASYLPIPTVLHHDTTGSLLGVPFLLTTGVPGTPLSAFLPYASQYTRLAIDGQLSELETSITRLTCPLFGPVTHVAAGNGYRCWRDAYKAMLGSVLKDGEDMFVNLPYASIRTAVENVENVLDVVMQAKLCVPGLGAAANVFVEERAQEVKVVGLVDFKSAFWGDAAILDGRVYGAWPQDTKGLL